jgi:hypothetical protein
LYYPAYEATYNNRFKADYYGLHYMDFYAKLYAVEGDYKEILRLRNLALYGKKTRYNKDEFRQGRKLLTKNQRKHLKLQNEDNEVARQEQLMVANEQLYLKYLEERGLRNGRN